MSHLSRFQISFHSCADWEGVSSMREGELLCILLNHPMFL